MSLDLKPSKYYRPIPLTDKELQDINRCIVNVGIVFSSVYDHINVNEIQQNLKSNDPFVFFIPCNGRYHDLEAQPMWTTPIGCHYYSGLVHFDLHHHCYGPEVKGACCDGQDRSCTACNNVIVLQRWWKKFNSKIY